MTREQKIERAKELREQGLTYREIAEELGQKYPTAVYRWLNPEKLREENLRRRVAKNEWERNNRAACPGCGAAMGAGSRCVSHRPKLCRPCRRAEEAEAVAVRGRRIEKWWAEGLTMSQIADRLGWTIGHLASDMDRLRAAGFNLPYRYTEGKRAGRKFAEQVAA